ncbi:MAG: hydrogenase nickel incorporation protein HypB [Planctomycetota bacterium]|nr:hydrogenase nickel incorporation protein HypB [Planctomycetota bacterium]
MDDSTTIKIGERILADNDRTAEETRERLSRMGLFMLNIMGSPGSGKTTILERTLRELAGELRIGVIEGDVETDRDARRVREAGAAAAIQIETRGACHLDAARVAGAIESLNLFSLDLLVVENIGNLICPAGFDLGEHGRVVVLSVPEGDDKPSKYPSIFLMPRTRAAILNKIDLTCLCPFSVRRFTEDLRSVNPKLRLLKLSAYTRKGFNAWLRFVMARVREGKKMRARRRRSSPSSGCSC